MQQVQGAGLFWSGRNAAESRDCRAAGGFQPQKCTVHPYSSSQLQGISVLCSTSQLQGAHIATLKTLVGAVRDTIMSHPLLDLICLTGSDPIRTFQWVSELATASTRDVAQRTQGGVKRIEWQPWLWKTVAVCSDWRRILWPNGCQCPGSRTL